MGFSASQPISCRDRERVIEYLLAPPRLAQGLCLKYGTVKSEPVMPSAHLHGDEEARGSVQGPPVHLVILGCHERQHGPGGVDAVGGVALQLAVDLQGVGGKQENRLGDC